jgi:hypothetical protein
MHSLHKRSFGIIILLIALAAIVPGLSIVAGLLLMVPSIQMVSGKSAPVFPSRIATRSLPTRRLAAVVQRSVPVLRYLERVIHPRWHTPPEATKRLVGAIVVMLSATLVFIPIPLSNLVPAVPIENQSRTYWWCSPPRIGRQRICPARSTGRENGASFSKERCVRAPL